MFGAQPPLPGRVDVEDTGDDLGLLPYGRVFECGGGHGAGPFADDGREHIRGGRGDREGRAARAPRGGEQHLGHGGRRPTDEVVRGRPDADRTRRAARRTGENTRERREGTGIDARIRACYVC
ncbi:hypothetical protein SHKM778_38990 [Streptomyces sp. KM77-8]|uniref:Uncharacterized protein n=1 Tax=Streptomyces haneummycinicus TaxID=3074435 RepID=A0AAT9HK59_9ACTN